MISKILEDIGSRNKSKNVKSQWKEKKRNNGSRRWISMTEFGFIPGCFQWCHPFHPFILNLNCICVNIKSYSSYNFTASVEVWIKHILHRLTYLNTRPSWWWCLVKLWFLWEVEACWRKFVTGNCLWGLKPHPTSSSVPTSSLWKQIHLSASYFCCHACHLLPCILPWWIFFHSASQNKSFLLEVTFDYGILTKEQKVTN